MQINLLPWREQKRKAQKKRLIRMTILFMLLALCIIGSFHLYFASKVNAQQRINDYLQAETNQEQKNLNNTSSKKKEKEILEQKLKFISKLYVKSYRGVNALKELAAITPSTIELDKITRREDFFTLRGKATSAAELSSYMKAIEKSPVFDQPTLSTLSEQATQLQIEKFFELVVKQTVDPAL